MSAWVRSASVRSRHRRPASPANQPRPWPLASRSSARRDAAAGGSPTLADVRVRIALRVAAAGSAWALWGLPLATLEVVAVSAATQAIVSLWMGSRGTSPAGSQQGPGTHPMGTQSGGVKVGDEKMGSSGGARRGAITPAAAPPPAGAADEAQLLAALGQAGGARSKLHRAGSSAKRRQF